jgi:hypothetical protein
VKSASGAKDLRIREDAVRARYILAFAAARRKDMKLSRDRFTVLQKEAAKLPDKGAQPPTPGMTSPTLEEEGAYQHAVCTAALGDKKAAEAEYISFMRDYPESTLIHGAVKRIELLHDGHLPKYAEAAWAKANGTAIARAQARREAEEKKWSRCGPLCMAEIFRRHGHALGVDALAKELKTGDKGTTMQAMADVAKKHGLKPRGLALTQKGLVKQPLPLIALIMPGHYVIVEEVTVDHVAVWDPYAKGVDKPGRTTFAIKRWKMMWGGVALVFENKLDPGGQDAD